MPRKKSNNPDAATLDRTARIFKALSNANRLRLYLEILRSAGGAQIASSGRCFLTDIVQGIPIESPTVSHHIKELVQADLISTERVGKQLACRINSETLATVQQLLALPD